MEGNITTRVVALGATLALVIGGGTGITATAAASTHGTGSKAVSTKTATAHGTTQGGTATSQVLAGGVAARTYVPRVTARWAGAVNVWNRAAVNASYWSNYAAGLAVPTGFTGDESTCRAGSTSATSQYATLRAINYVRSLAGLYPVGLNATLNARSQLTALMMSANRTLSHYPSTSWRCYTATGAANAAVSNIALAYPSLNSASVVGMYMSEPGSSNVAVGHRRWLMNPFTTQVGTGATNTANAITVIGPSSYYRPNPAWVSWPTAGYFPNSLEPSGRWSLSTGNKRLNFSRASVRVWRNGVPVGVAKQPVHNGYAMPTIVWEMPDAVAKSGTFRVLVSGIRKGKKRKKYSYAYTVAMFTPTH